EHRFAKRVAEALESLVRERDPPAIVIAAPPRTLADLRSALSRPVRERTIAEINKDFTGHPVYDIERLVLASLD
ncbi:MAG TPA: host attachment protein, partial [Roseiarcus sp.]|nr:host attachment protein [Roseiarcus sp.]